MFNQKPSEVVATEDSTGRIIESPEFELLKKPILNGVELLKLPAMPNNYLVDKILWENQIVILLAKEKVGKSILSLQLACAMSCGEPFLGEFDVIKPLKVLYIQAEGDRYETINRIKTMVSSGIVNWNPDNFYHWFPPALTLDREDGLQDFIEHVTNMNVKVDVIILDPLYTSMVGSLVDEEASRMFCRNVRTVQEKFGCSFLINHHEHRPVNDPQTGWAKNEGDNSIMGSFVWKAFPSHILRLQNNKEGIRTLTCQTQRNGQVEETLKMQLAVRNGSDYPDGYTVIQEEPTRVEQIYNLILTLEQNSFTFKDITGKFGIKDAAVRRALTLLQKQKKIKKISGSVHPVVYTLRKEV